MHRNQEGGNQQLHGYVPDRRALAARPLGKAESNKNLTRLRGTFEMGKMGVSGSKRLILAGRE